jgi:hypothetical protein
MGRSKELFEKIREETSSINNNYCYSCNACPYDCDNRVLNI